MKKFLRIIAAFCVASIAQAQPTTPIKNARLSGTNYVIDGGTLSPNGGTIIATPSATLDLLGTTRGSVLYRGASGWTLLPPGNNGYILQSGGAGADPSWVVGVPGTVSWGAIQGTLSNQSDLQAALDAKVSTTTANGWFADPSTNGSFSASTWRSDLGLAPIATSGSASDLSSGTIPIARVPSTINGFNAKFYGAVGSGLVDDAPAIQSAIDAASAAGGATVWLPYGLYRIDSTINLKKGVVLKGDSAGNYGDPATGRGTTIKPSATFTGSTVILADSANGAGLYMSGCSIADMTIDMDSLAASQKRVISFLSVSNTRPIENVTVINNDDNTALHIGNSDAVGALASDGIEIVSFFTFGKTVDYASTVSCLVIDKGANEITFRGGKFQRRSSSVISGTTAASVLSGAKGILFSGTAFAGCETGVKVYADDDTYAAPEWVRFEACTFETYRYGITINAIGDNSSFYPRSIVVLPGNRFISAGGANPRNVLVDKSRNAVLFMDDYISGGTGTPLLVEITANALGANVSAQPAQSSNSSTTSLLMGRQSGGTGLSVPRLVSEAGMTIAPGSGALSITGNASISGGVNTLNVSQFSNAQGSDILRIQEAGATKWTAYARATNLLSFFSSSGGNVFELTTTGISTFAGKNITSGGVFIAGSTPTTLTDSAGKILSAALNTVQPAQGGTGLTALGTGVATWLGTPSSANLAAAVTDETGSGALVFAASPTFTGTVTAANLTTSAGRVVAITADTSTSITLNGTHDTVTVSNASPVTVNLPALASNQGRRYVIKNVGAGTATVDPNSTETIFTTSAVNTVSLNTGDSVTITAFPSYWIVQ